MINPQRAVVVWFDHWYKDKLGPDSPFFFFSSPLFETLRFRAENHGINDQTSFGNGVTILPTRRRYRSVREVEEHGQQYKPLSAFWPQISSPMLLHFTFHPGQIESVNGIFIRSNPNIRIFDAELWIRRIICLHRFVEPNP
jgi:hypothetical protein